jgi:UDP-N-acetylmuramoyl-tripeptide--D-alanyl-D-alanine ligase
MFIELPFGIIIKDLEDMCGGKVIVRDEKDKFITFHYISSDTRQSVDGALFVAIKGKKFDGHDFLEEAQKKGAVAALVSSENKNLKIPQILVENTREAFLKIGQFVKRKINPFTIAVGGSAGKTTTKELIYFLFSQLGFKVQKSIKSFNNEIGLAVSTSSLKNDTEILVLEIGTSSKGEIKYLSQFAEPNFAVLVSCGKEHLEGLGSPEEVFEEETELIKFVVKKGGIPFVNIEAGDLRRFFFSLDCPEKVAFGLGNENMLEQKIRYGFFSNPISVSRNFETDFSLSILFDDNSFKEIVRTNLAPHFESNVSAAISVLFLYLKKFKGIKEDEILKLIKKKVNFKEFSNEFSRFKIDQIRNFVIVDDSYNSNPLSLSAMFYSASFVDGKKLFALGDMLELGKYSEEEHFKVGESAKKYISPKDSFFLLYGNYAKFMEEGLKNCGFSAEAFKSKIELIQKLKEIYKDFDFIFFKASRGLKFDEIAKDFILYLRSSH